MNSYLNKTQINKLSQNFFKTETHSLINSKNLNNKTPRELPFIIHPQSKIKIFIDTGSTHSYITPYLANKIYKNQISFDPIIVTSAHGSSKQNFAVKRPFFEIFINNIPLVFYL